jgi:hypothetical protein
MARGWRGNFAKAHALIIDENGCHPRIIALQFTTLKFAHCLPQCLLSAPFVRNGRDALVADERATLAVAGRWRLAKQRRNGVYFVGRDRGDGAQNRVALHAAHLLAEKFFSTPTNFPTFRLLARLAHWQLPFGKCGCLLGL